MSSTHPWPNVPDERHLRPSWRKWSAYQPQLCRCCGKPIWKGWRAMGVYLLDPYLCGACWTAGNCLELG